MARIRSIKPEFWQNETMASLPAETRLLAIALLNHSDDHGYFMAHPQLVRAACCPFLESSVNDHGTITEASGIVHNMLQELSNIGWIEVRKSGDGRLIGKVCNFKVHQYVQRPQNSKIADIFEATGAITDRSRNDHGSLQSNSVLDQGSGIRDQGTGEKEKYKKEKVPNSGTEPYCPLIDRLPPKLDTKEFRAIWMKWTAYCYSRDGRHNEPQLDLNLMTLLEREGQGGVQKAIADLRYSIESGTKGRIYDSSMTFAVTKDPRKPQAAEEYPNLTQQLLNDPRNPRNQKREQTA